VFLLCKDLQNNKENKTLKRNQKENKSTQTASLLLLITWLTT
jgi:hypothetical protein